VKVELLAVSPKDEPNRQVVLVQYEAGWPKGCLDARDVAESDHQVEVFVLPGFAPQERIDTPPPVECRLDPARTEKRQKLEDSFGSHPFSLGAA
jgi:hypothetical protein